MGKGKSRKNRDDNTSVSSGKKKDNISKSKQSSNTQDVSSSPPTTTPEATATTVLRRRSFYQWCLQERQGMVWVSGCAIFGCLFGFGVGSGWIVGEYGRPPSMWRINLGGKIRASETYKIFVHPFAGSLFSPTEEPLHINSASFATRMKDLFGNKLSTSKKHKAGSLAVRKIDPEILRRNPSHPYVYAVLREAIVREIGGYVHPDLGILEPAPCGAARGIGMVRDVYHNCQTKCIPGLAKEKLQAQGEVKFSSQHTVGPPERKYMQEEVLIKVPLSYQMTRKVALDTLLPLIPADVQRKANLHELDDAALLVLLLAHERGVGIYSRWLPYIASLPTEPSCGYSRNLRPYLLDSINALRDEIGMDVNGWPGELLKATQYSEQIVNGLTKDYGPHLQHPKGLSAHDNIEWALCQVASRATGGSQKHGALRMIPLLDMINHNSAAGGFVELTGKERLEEGDFVDATDESDEGAFVVRSLRHGRRKALRPGQELLVNYNVPHYSALDWFVSLGFVPPERYEKWQKLDAPLPRIRNRVFPGIKTDG
jgi:hypothetical protein